jgi:hypothetical protein
MVMVFPPGKNDLPHCTTESLPVASQTIDKQDKTVISSSQGLQKLALIYKH